MKTGMGLAVLGAALVLTACGSDNKKPKDEAVAPEKLSGVYQQKGYGNTLAFNNGQYKIYHALDKFCWLGAQGAIADLNISEAQLNGKDRRLSLTFPGSQAFPVKLDKLNKLPDTCNTPIANAYSPVKNFEVFWHAINDLYAFFPERKINWQQQYKKYAPVVNEQLSEEELFEVLSHMMSGFNDSHTTLEAEINGESFDFSAAPETGFSQYAASLNTTAEELVADTFERSLELMQQYAGAELKQFGDDQPLWWAKSEDNVGYIMLSALGGFSAEEDNVADDIGQASAAFKAMMADLAGTDAIIIDNRFNGGGYGDISAQLARYFLNKPQAVLQKHAKNRLATTDLMQLHLTPAATSYSKPVFLINSQLSVSAGETFSIMMKDLPQVTLLGEATNGALSDMLQVNLPNGWLLTLSNERYLDMQGKSYEVSGVPAGLQTPVFSQQDYALERLQAYDTALSLVGKTHAVPVSFDDVETLIDEAIAKKLLPGIAIAALKNGEIIYSKGFGQAADNTPATADTPFFLASVSKVFNGTLAAIMTAEKKISPDLPVSGNIGFELSVPEHFSQPVLFKHLLSHTSGIVDGENFNCGYFFSEDGSSLYNAFYDDIECPEPAYQTLEAFIPNYLQQSGNRYQDSNYQQDTRVQPGEKFSYSNVGSATAALLMSVTAGKPYTDLFAEKLTIPLQLPDIRWDITGDSIANTATRYAKSDDEFVAYPAYGANSWPDGFLTASANDMAEFATAILAADHPVITDDVKELMFSPLLEEYLGQGIGYFWGLDNSYASHEGADPGVTTLLLLDRASRNALIVLINTDDTDNDALNDFVEQLQVTAWHAIRAAN